MRPIVHSCMGFSQNMGANTATYMYVWHCLYLILHTPIKWKYGPYAWAAKVWSILTVPKMQYLCVELFSVQSTIHAICTDIPCRHYNIDMIHYDFVIHMYIRYYTHPKYYTRQFADFGDAIMHPWYIHNIFKRSNIVD